MKHRPPASSQAPHAVPALGRREFLRTSAMAAALAGVARPFNILRAQDGSVNDKPNIAAIGVAGQGGGVVHRITSGGGRLAAFCDVSEVHPFGGDNVSRLRDVEKIPYFKDYRVMFDKLGKELDGVVVTVPDHSHFGPTITALQLGIATYTEKPLTKYIGQTRRLMKAAREAGVATQAGNQGQSVEGIRNLKEWIMAGLLGEIQEIHVWLSRDNWGQRDLPPEEPVPAGMDWDLWLGPAQERPHSTIYYPYAKRGGLWKVWTDFGTSQFGDFGMHLLNTPYFALDLPMPTRLTFDPPPLRHKGCWPRIRTVTYHLPATERHGAMKLHWYEGGAVPPVPPGLGEDFNYKDKDNDRGVFIIGSKASVHSIGWYGESIRIFPESKMQELQSQFPPKTLPRVKGSHTKNWIDGIKNREHQPSSHFGYSGPLNEFALLPTIPMQLGLAEIEYDPAKGLFVGNDEANELLNAPPPRKGWEGLA